MICLTGDVHHTSLRINDSRFIPDPGDTEIKIARRYMELMEKYGVKVTLYICGKSFTEEWDDLKPTATHPLVEIGGHGYRSRQPRRFFDWYGRRTGNWNGPRWFQAWDIRKSLEVCEERTGYRFVSWRAHSYKVDPNTYPLLAKYGVKVVSDDIRARNLWPERICNGLVSHPMNVIPDHDHLYHAHRTREFVERANKSGYGADEFGAVSYTAEEWGRRVIARTMEIEQMGGITTILAHPLCHYLADRFKTLETLLEAFRGIKMIWARDVLDYVDKQPEALREERPHIDTDAHR